MAAVVAQPSHPLSQTGAVGPPAPTPPLTPPLMCPVHVLLSFLGWAPCLLPQATLLQNRWVPSDCWAPIPRREPSRHFWLPLSYQQCVGQTLTQ